jgi:hypothetical protein
MLDLGLPDGHDHARGTATWVPKLDAHPAAPPFQFDRTLRKSACLGREQFHERWGCGSFRYPIWRHHAPFQLAAIQVQCAGRPSHAISARYFGRSRP